MDLLVWLDLQELVKQPEIAGEIGYLVFVWVLIVYPQAASHVDVLQMHMSGPEPFLYFVYPEAKALKHRQIGDLRPNMEMNAG